MEVIAGPAIETRPAQHYLGIRTITPFRGMLGTRDILMNKLFAWLKQRDLVTASFFMRLHVIDMNGPMDIEVGAIVPQRMAGDGRVRPAVLPAGEYATLAYREHDRRANGTLLDWLKAEKIDLDREDVEAGDRFACRYEAYLTDPRTEPRKKRWIVQLNMLTRRKA